MVDVLRLFLRLSISPNCSRNILLELLIRIQVQSMRALLKIVSSPLYWSPVSKSFPRSIMDLSLGISAITPSLSTTISSLVLRNRALLDRTYRGIYGVLNILGFYLNVFLQTGCGNFTFFILLCLWPTQRCTRYVHGQRVICSTLETIQILNFARPMHPSSPGTHKTFLRSNPSLIPKESIFVKDVVTHLPYYIVNRAIAQHFFAYMIDEERIIGLRVSFIFKDDGDGLFSTLIF